MFSSDEKNFLVGGLRPFGISLSEINLQKLASLVEALLEWNSRINLTAITKKEEVLEKHLIDSLALLPHLNDGSLMDVGAGAGFPGLPVAIIQPERRIVLVEATRKKVEFIREVVRILDLPGCETTWAHLPDKKIILKTNQIVSRGTFKVKDFLRGTLPSLEPHGRLILMKGKLPSDELKGIDQLIHKARLRQSIVPYQLPYSRAERTLIIWDKLMA
ncbi:MAG: 16S rRNA (guanine(527)-N(7))-methyltransferase RsmG [Deltaproteobacteria bacterium]|nr:16S rRNA (guanine(527)-N(7))-methyltransferase RsmG [Deltaproteobacteria bacterium]